MNDYGVLIWDPFTIETSLNFIELTIFYNPATKHTKTKVYEKLENLHLLILPCSTHAPGALKGSIVGALYRYKRICSCIQDISEQAKKYFYHISSCGHRPNVFM